jgi:hypothetical protein
MRTVKLDAANFKDEEGKRCITDQLGATNIQDALIWEGALNANTLNPFIAGLQLNERVRIEAVEGDKVVATIDTIYVHYTTVKVDIHNPEVRFEFRGIDSADSDTTGVAQEQSQSK